MLRKDVIRQIVDRETQHLGLTEETVSQDAPELYQSACNQFGTWDTALEYAGIRLSCLLSNGGYSREEIVRKIRRYCRKALRPTVECVHHYDYCLQRAACEQFGSWRLALLAAGVATEAQQASKPKRKWDKQLITDHIQRRFRDGKPMHHKAIRRDDGGLLHAAIRHFGGWSQALDAAGIHHSREIENSTQSTDDRPAAAGSSQDLQ